MIVADSLERIDSVLTLDSLSEPLNPKMPKDSSIELSHVCFSYDFEKNNSISSELNRNFPSSEGVTSETSLSSSGAVSYTHLSGGNEKNVSLFCGNIIADFKKSSVFYSLLKFFFRDVGF